MVESVITAVVSFVKNRDSKRSKVSADDEEDRSSAGDGDEEDEDADLQVIEEYQQLTAVLACVDVKTRDVREKVVKEKLEKAKVVDDDVEIVFRGDRSQGLGDNK